MGIMGDLRINISKTMLMQFKNIFFESNLDNIPVFSKNHTPNNVIKFLLKKLITNENNFTLNEAIHFSTRNPSKKTIPLTESYFYKNNSKVVNSDGTINPDSWMLFQKRFYDLKKMMESSNISFDDNIEIYEDDEDDSSKLKPTESNEYQLYDYYTITDIYNILSKSRGDCFFKYDFPSSTPSAPDSSIKTVQHWRLQIQSFIDKYTKFVRFHYHCPVCGADIWRDYNDLVSTKGVVFCDNMVEGNGGRLKKCNTRLSEPTQLSDSIVVYRYDASYVEEGKKYNIMVESLYELENFEYDCAGVVLVEKGVDYLFVLDYVPIKKHKLEFLPKLTLVSADSPNKIPDLIRFIDDKIYEYSGDRVLGMYDIKFYFLVQKLTQILGLKRIWNIALSGKNDTGKTYIIDRYGSFLYGGYYKKTFGQTTSLPALRGSSRSNREVSIGNKNRLGMLNTFDCIYIDEIFENPTLMEELKPILLEDEFSNDKADGDRIEYEKRAQVCIAENPDREHLSKYENMIRKRYNQKLEDGTVNTDEIEEWSDKWDLYQPVYTYSNPLLRKCIDSVRTELRNQDKHFLDGRSISIHDRFPIYLSLERDVDAKILQRANAAIESELEAEQQYLDLKKKLAVENINDFFLRYKDFLHCKFDGYISDKIIELVEDFGFEPRSRLVSYCARVLNVSRILNQRNTFYDIDFEYVKRYLYLMDRRVKISEMEDIEPKSSIPDIKNIKDDIEEETSSKFGLGSEDFEDESRFNDLF